MGRFHKKFTTKKTKQEMKDFLNNSLLTLPILKASINTIEWDNYKLIFTSKLGDGFFLLEDCLVEIDIELNFMGQMSMGLIENTFEQEIKKLN